MPRNSPATFTLSPQTLEHVFAACRIPVPPAGLALFAIRGGLPSGTAKGWTRSIPITQAPVDHDHMRCALCLWDIAGGRVFAARGSTVPHRDNVLKSAARKGSMRGRGTNQLEPGYYTDLAKGEHLQGKRNGHQALRQTGSRLYRRSLTGVPYAAKSPLYFGNPYDNLHCGWNLDGKAAGFSSAGCMVVAGMPHCPRREDAGPNLGPWKTFHDLLYAAPQKTFPILLLPFAQAMRAAGGGEVLVYGSEGDAVAALQRKLAEHGDYRGRATGKLDARTYRAWKQPR